MKRIFNKEFGRPPGVYFEWIKNYGCVNYRYNNYATDALKTKLWLRYRVVYDGIEILRDFEPLCKEDALAESLKLWELLDTWKKFPQKENKNE